MSFDGYGQKEALSGCLSPSDLNFQFNHQHTRAAVVSAFNIGTWHLALGTWHLALGTWHLALGTWHLALGTWPMSRRPVGVNRFQAAQAQKKPPRDEAAFLYPKIVPKRMAYLD
ncbi:hypothetical protein AOR01nite_15000 [Acetobacter orleanensis]|uniref:Uncharacterized protein n=1 Tax=Acetobacter orleanensis TaxID=104099 RepID=A0A4Y3TMR1_9PROT|nr:hypothetical protein AOR01nite_15000 [Acetobacter orleanensis]